MAIKIGKSEVRKRTLGIIHTGSTGWKHLAEWERIFGKRPLNAMNESERKEDKEENRKKQ